MRSLIIAGVLLVLTAGVVASAEAQQSGIITGRVRDPGGNPLPNARVRLLGATREALTGNDGIFRLVGVAAGERRVIVEYMGMQSDTAAVSVEPNRSSRLDLDLRISPIALEGIEVTGERRAQLRAINEQRSSPTLINVVAGDEIGKLPDQNVAEAAQRVAGVSIQTSRGEGRFVSIRGTAPNLNNVTLNGEALASTAGSRATALDLLPSAMVSAIRITKAVTPDMDANAVGGTIDIQTLSAFDRSEPFLFGSIRNHTHQRQVNYGDKKVPYELEFTSGRRFGTNQQLGLVLAGSASRRDFAASVLDPDGWEDVDGVILPQELELQVEDNERERYGVGTNLDWRPRASTSLFVRGLFTRTREVTSNSEYEFGFAGDVAMESATTGRYSGGSAELDLSQDNERETLLGLTLGGRQLLNRWITWDLAGTFTRGMLDDEGPDATFETTDEDALANRFDVAPYFFVIEPLDPGFVGSPANYPLRSANWNVEKNRENTWVGATNMRFDTKLGRLPAYLKTGAKLLRRDKLVDQHSFRYVPQGLNLAPYALPATGTVQGGSAAFVHGDVRRFSSFFRNQRNNSQHFALDENATRLNEVDGDSDNNETVLAGYVMAGTDLGRLNVLAGARVERTETRTKRYEVDENRRNGAIEAATATSFDRSYTNLLPAIVLKFAATNNLVLRAAWTNTIGRPDYDNLAAFRRVRWRTTSAANVFDGQVSEGNPDLHPYEASNLDGSAEYYFPFGGMAGVGVFRKRIDNPIYDVVDTRRNVTFEGRFYRELVLTQDRNADAGTLQGIELSYSQPLFFLPAPLNSLGITANAAFIDSEVSVPGRVDETLTFFGQSDRVINLIPYFQRGPIELRLAYTYRGPYLDQVGGEAFQDRYGDKRATFDLTGRYLLLHDRFELFGMVRNLTNEPEVGFQGNSSRYDVHTLTGRTFTFGVSTKF